MDLQRSLSPDTARDVRLKDRIGLQKLHKVLDYQIIKPDLDNATTIKALVNKLHCELQEIRRKAASGLQEKSKICM